MKEWEEFKDSGLLWFVNRQLHLFGWSLVLTEDQDTGEIFRVTPQRTKFRGFGYAQEKEGFDRITDLMVKELPKLKENL